MTIRVAIADDHAILRQGLVQLLRNTGEIELVADVADGDQLLEAVRESRPDIAVSDVSMPTFGAEQLAKDVVRENLTTRVVALTVHEEPEIVAALLRAGVAGYVLKKNAFSELLEAILTVHQGGRFVSPTLAGNLLTANDPSGTQRQPLSEREHDVLVGIASGWPYKRVARELDISVRTVETYRERLLKKLSLATTADLIRFATEQSYLDD